MESGHDELGRRGLLRWSNRWSDPRSTGWSSHDWTPLEGSSRQVAGTWGGPVRTPTRRPRRVPPRSCVRGSSIHSVMHRVQERDLRISVDLLEHRVLTTRQLVELHRQDVDRISASEHLEPPYEPSRAVV